MLKRGVKTAQKGTKDKSLKLQLKLFQDDKGIWRCGGRFDNADIPYAMKYPILLPRDHSFTRLVVEDAHRRVLHNGVRDTLTEIRSRFWIERARSLVRALLHRCVKCQRYEGPSYPVPPPPLLPAIRIEAPAFTFTGVDFAGPLVITTGKKSSNKVWICLFTCLVVRAVHLDVVTDLSTEAFLRCLCTFAARRGLPLRMLSDNGKTFKAAAKYVRSVYQDDTV